MPPNIRPLQQIAWPPKVDLDFAFPNLWSQHLAIYNIVHLRGVRWGHAWSSGPRIEKVHTTSTTSNLDQRSTYNPHTLQLCSKYALSLPAQCHFVRFKMTTIRRHNRLNKKSCSKAHHFPLRCSERRGSRFGSAPRQRSEKTRSFVASPASPALGCTALTSRYVK